MADEKPTEEPTVDIEKPPAWAISMAEKMENGFRGLRADVSLVTPELNVGKGSVQNIQEWRELLEERLKNNSIRAKSSSEVDMRHDAELAAEKEARETLAGEVATIKAQLVSNSADTLAIRQAVVDGVRGFWNRNPKLETALVGLILAGIGVAYAWLTHGGHS